MEKKVVSKMVNSLLRTLPTKKKNEIINKTKHDSQSILLNGVV